MCTLGICEGVHNEDWNREKSQALDLSIQIQSIKHVVIVQYSRQAEADLGRQGSMLVLCMTWFALYLHNTFT